MITHPMEIRVSRAGGSVEPVVKFDPLSIRPAQGCFPLVDFGMAVRKRESAGSIVISGGLINPIAYLLD